MGGARTGGTCWVLHAWRDAAVRAGTTRQETLAAPACSCVCQVFGLTDTPPAPKHFEVFWFFRGGRSSSAGLGRAELGRGRGAPYLWRDVVWGPAEGVGPGVSQHVLLAHPEVCDFDVSIFV